jgi:oligoribonuclease NrnB/cAMP/cGMP phosphodiesterase (DHH superfamily)
MVLYNYVIFHRGCLDGFTSFVVLHKSGKIADDAVIYPDVPSAKFPPQQIENKHIIILDVAYKYDVLTSITDKAKSVTFIDHHVTIHDDVKKIQNDGEKIKIIYDENECGATLTWKFFNGKRKIPLFIKYIRDNDIGTWKLKYTHEFIAALDANHTFSLSSENLYKWNLLFNETIVKALIKKGKVYKEYMDHLLDMNSRRYSMELFPSENIYEQYSDYFKKPAEFKVAVVCGTGCPSSSLLGAKMMEILNCDFVIIWNLHLDKKEYILSFRSKEVDVGHIAKMFGGGGHKLAAACSFPITKHSIQDLFFPNSLPRQNKN